MALLLRTLRSIRERWDLFLMGSGVLTGAMVLLGGFLLIASNIGTVLASWEKDVHISAYFPSSTTEEDRDQLKQQLSARPEVAEVVYVSEADARAWMAEQLPEMQPVMDDLGEDALPASLEITLRSDTPPETIAAFAAELDGGGDFLEIDYGRDWADRVGGFFGLLRSLGVALGGLIAVAALFLVGNTVHLAILARRDELEILRLVGATDFYILGPFLVEGGLAGLTGGLVAQLALWALHQLLMQQLDAASLSALGLGGLSFLPGPWLLGMLALSAGLGMFANLVTVRRFLGRLP